jgi:hypothetical protein
MTDLYFEQLLIGEMIARIDFEYEHVIDTWSTPSIRVEADENDVQYDEERTSVQFDGYFPVERKRVVFRIAHEY